MGSGLASFILDHPARNIALALAALFIGAIALLGLPEIHWRRIRPRAKGRTITFEQKRLGL